MEEYRARLQQHYGAAMVTAHAFEIGMARFYPSLKRALGRGPQLRTDDREGGR